MKREKIIETIKRHSISRHFGEYYEITQEDCEDCADELLSLIEQEKKETAKEILKDLYDEAMRQQCETVNLTAYYIKNTLAKEYGVEL